MFCPQCGAKVPDGSTFCPTCGTGLGESTPDTPTPAAPPVQQASPSPATPPTPPSQPTSPAPPSQPTAPPQPTAPGTPYPRGPLGGRLLALIADSIIASALLPLAMLLYIPDAIEADATGGVPFLGLGLLAVAGLWYTAYFLGRDAFGGAGFGKRLAGLVVASTDSGSIARAGATIVRQVVLFALNLIPLIGGLIEPLMVLVDKEGRRLGDKAAKTQVVKASDLAARGVPVAHKKGAAIAAVIVALLVNIVGSAIGGVALVRALNAPPDWQIDTGHPLQSEVEPAPPVGVPPGQPTEPIEPPAPTPEPEPEPAAPVVNQDTAVHAVGEMLYALKNDDVERARSFTTRSFQSEYDWFLYPTAGALLQFEVVETFPDPPSYGVVLSEQWKSGPEEVLYFVVEEDGQAKVDSLFHDF